MFAFYILVDVECNAGQLPPNDRFQVQLYALLEVVQSVDQSPDISLQRPASLCLLNQPHKVIKRISLDQLTNVNRVVIVDQRRHNLEETAQIGQFRTHYYLLTTSVVVLVLLNQRSYVLLSRVHYILIRVILHNFEDLNLMTPQTSSIAVYQIPEEIQQLALIVAIL